MAEGKTSPDHMRLRFNAMLTDIEQTLKALREDLAYATSNVQRAGIENRIGKWEIHKRTAEIARFELCGE